MASFKNGVYQPLSRSTNYQVLRPVKQQNAPPLTASDSNQVGTKKSAENGWLIKGNAWRPPTPSSPAPSHTPRPAHHALIHPPPPLLPKGERRSERNVRSSENNYDTRAKTSNEESIFCFYVSSSFTLTHAHTHTCTHKHLYTHTHLNSNTHASSHTITLRHAHCLSLSLSLSL